jgi:Protein of unknown function (DUF2842)
MPPSLIGQRDLAPHAGEPVPRRTRKLIGTVLLIALVVVWSLFFTALAQGRIAEAGRVWQLFYYLVAGAGWVIPAAVLVRWMQRPDA